SSPPPPMLPMKNRSTISSTAAAPMMMMYSRFSRQNGSSARWAPWKDTASASSSNRSGGYGYWESATAPLNLLGGTGAGSTRPGEGGSGDPMRPVGAGGAVLGGAPAAQPMHHGRCGAQGRRLVEQGVQPHVIGDLGQADLLADRALLRADVPERAALEGEDPPVAVAQAVLRRGGRGVRHLGARPGGGVGVAASRIAGHVPRVRARRARPPAARRPGRPVGGASPMEDWGHADPAPRDHRRRLGRGPRPRGGPPARARRLPARRDGGRTRLPARRRPGAARLHPPALRGAGAHRGPGPVPHAGPPDRPVLRGGPRGAAPPPLARQHLRRAGERPGDPPRPARRPHRL